jgi:hypothetical protein
MRALDVRGRRGASGRCGAGTRGALEPGDQRSKLV